jgi:sulfite exporter TauE/SafE
MIGWLMIVAGGLLGSAHCVGMCGGFALALGAAGRSHAANLRRQLTYGLGRVFTYSVFGVAAGYAGMRMTMEWQQWMNIQAILSVAAGLLLVAQGLEAAGVLRWRKAAPSSSPCLGPSLFGALLGATRLRSVFLAGMINGLLPCGLVYAFVALAASSGDLWRGAATMALFGLGTLPVMVLVGVGGLVLRVALRRRVLTVAAWCVALTGVLSIIRGLGFVQIPGLLDAPGCPLCHG